MQQKIEKANSGSDKKQKQYDAIKAQIDRLGWKDSVTTNSEGKKMRMNVKSFVDTLLPKVKAAAVILCWNSVLLLQHLT